MTLTQQSYEALSELGTSAMMRRPVPEEYVDALCAALWADPAVRPVLERYAAVDAQDVPEAER